MATAEKVLKPDFETRRKHFIFNEEHDQLRESIRAFVKKELAPSGRITSGGAWPRG